MNKRLVIIVVTLLFSMRSFSQCSVCATCNTSTSSGCTWTVSANSTTNYTVKAGQKLCITGGTYKGGITLEGGTIVVGSGATFKPASFSIWYDASWNTGGKIEIQSGATAAMASITYQYDSALTISNCGTLSMTGAITLQGNGTVVINNAGTFTSSNDIITQTNNKTICNSGTMSIKNFTAQNGYTLNNSGKITITGNLTQQYGTINVCNGSYIAVKGNWTNQSGTVTGTSSCGAIKISGTSTCQSCTVNGTVDICDSSAYNNSPPPGVDVNQSGTWGSGVTYCKCYVLTLPITLLEFKASVENEIVKVEWRTAIEYDNDYFTVEKSKDGINYHSIAKVKGAGNSTEVLSYYVLDEQPAAGVIYYRLSQTDFNGKMTVYTPVAVEVKNVFIYPNPVVNNLNFTFYSESSTALVSVYDISGKLVYEKQLPASRGMNKATLDLSFLAKGVYTLKAETSEGTVIDRLLK